MTSGLSLFPWAAYTLDAWQRSVLFLDVLRRRGNAFIKAEDDPMRHVLSFGFEVVMDGRDLPRPVNDWMARLAAVERIFLGDGGPVEEGKVRRLRPPTPRGGKAPEAACRQGGEGGAA